MNNNLMYPFERNRYYAGKMLTSADFQAEQNYFNDKRRFINNLVCGSGIICGLGVFSLDDLSLMVESGAAIDEQGREIVVESSVVKKLSAIEGFDGLKTNYVSLCLKYEEKQEHTVYALNSQNIDKEYEYNRIKEGFKLFLKDKEKEASFKLETEFLTSAVLMEHNDYDIEITMPSTVCRGRNVKAVVRVIKKTDEVSMLSYTSKLQAPAFVTQNGDHEISISFQNVSLAKGESISREYWLNVQEELAESTNIVLKADSQSASVNGEGVNAVSGLSLKIMLTDDIPRALINREIGHINLEMKNMSAAKDYIPLAELKLVRTESAYIIEKVIENGIKKYIDIPAQQELRSKYMDYFVKEADITLKNKSSVDLLKNEKMQDKSSMLPEVSTGTLEIPLGENAKRGDICCSGEIIHGLGKGNVYVEIGYEYIAEDTELGGNAKSTIYGNPELFSKDRRAMIDTETAVKVLNDKGSFIVAAKLLQNVDYLVLTYRWVAIKFPAGNDLGFFEEYSDKSISVETPTVILGTKESYFFNVRYHNMKTCSVVYELTEPGSGEITAEGVYTAPSKEGVYEIRIFCADMPVICTYAYAIVRKKGFE